MNALRKFLKTRLEGARSIAVIGIGSDLRGDDVAGILAAKSLETLAKKKKKRKIKVFFGATAPENITGEIKNFGPSHIIIIDTAEIEEKPGTILVLTLDETGGGISFSTHTMPAKILAEYFLKSFTCDCIIIGIQPKSLKFGSKASKAVASAAKEVAAAISSFA